jgi:hypothetical protein
MPAKPSWHANIPVIRRTLVAMTATPFLDRPTVQRLFGVRARQANNIMQKLEGYKVGPAKVIDRQNLILQLDLLAGHRGVALAETKRKSRVIEVLDDLRHEARPRRVTPPPPRPANIPLPACIHISAPGQLAISFSSPEDLLGSIMALAESASSDFARFARGLEYTSPRNGVCTDDPHAHSPEQSPTDPHPPKP